jgi:hypothetical protein
MLDDDDDDLPVPTVWELERIPKRPRDPRRKQRLLADAELYTRLSAQYGPQIFDHGLTARAIVRAITSWFDDCDLWLEATGQDPVHRKERLALECWLWETHDRSGRLGAEDPQGGKKGARNPDRWKLKKSPDHDRPWPAPPSSPLARWIVHGAVLDLVGHSKHPPRKWSPRRWFGPCPSGKPLTISIAGAKDRRGMLAEIRGLDDGQLAEMQAAGDDRKLVVDNPLEPLTQRKDLKPLGFWSVGREGGELKWEKKRPQWHWRDVEIRECVGPLDVKIWEVEPKHPHRALRCDVPIWRARYEPEIDVDPPQSVLEQTHEPPSEPELLEIRVGVLRWQGRLSG